MTANVGRGPTFFNIVNSERAEADSVEMAECCVGKGDEVRIEVYLGYEERIIGSVVLGRDVVKLGIVNIRARISMAGAAAFQMSNTLTVAPPLGHLPARSTPSMSQTLTYMGSGYSCLPAAATVLT